MNKLAERTTLREKLKIAAIYVLAVPLFIGGFWLYQEMEYGRHARYEQIRASFPVDEIDAVLKTLDGKLPQILDSEKDLELGNMRVMHALTQIYSIELNLSEAEKSHPFHQNLTADLIPGLLLLSDGFEKHDKSKYDSGRKMVLDWEHAVTPPDRKPLNIFGD